MSREPIAMLLLLVVLQNFLECNNVTVELKMKIYDHEEIRGWRERRVYIRLPYKRVAAGEMVS